MFSLIKKASAVFAIAAVVLTGPVASAATVGSIEGGNIYRVKNVTQNIDFTDPVNATCGDTVQFKVRVHNPGPDTLPNVKVAATLPSQKATSHSSTATVSSDDANPSSRSDTAGVKTDKESTIAYVAGSTQLLDPNNSVMQNLSDGIVGGGVNIPNGVGVSLGQIRFVQFSAKINCADVPVCTVNCTPETPKTPETPVGVTPGAIASTGPAELFSGLAGVSALGYGVQRYVASRRQQ